VAWYPFNGNANDESGNGNHGTVNGATLTTDRNGNSNSAYSFDGISNSILVPDASSNDVSTSYTLSVWFNPNLVYSNPISHILGKWGNLDAAYHLRALSSGKIDFYISNGSQSSFIESTNTVSNNQWTYITVSVNNQVACLYLNGNLISTIN
jgi:hypothetical protein